MARLRRMRRLAGGLLVLMAALYVTSSVGVRWWGGAAYLRAFAEAAIVGGVADWFAVTALFRRPLGLPIPHTALVPRSQARIGTAFGRFFVDNFLSARVLDARLRSLELAGWGGGWLREPSHASALASRIVRIAPDGLRALPEGALVEAFRRAVLAAARATPVAPTASTLLALLWRGGRAEALVDWGAERLGAYLQENQEVILEKVQAQSWRWLPSWVDRAIARRITTGLVQLLSDIRQGEHPWRVGLAGWVEAWIGRLAEDTEVHARAEAFKDRLLATPEVGAEIIRVGRQLSRRLENGGLDPAALERGLATLLQRLGVWLAEDEGVQRTLNVAARALVRRTLQPRREEIGRFVAQVVEGWDAESAVERLELLVGPDLQYIRVNGTLVGGLAGLLLYTAARALHLG